MQTICIIDAGAGQKKMPLLFTPFTVTLFLLNLILRTVKLSYIIKYIL